MSASFVSGAMISIVLVYLAPLPLLVAALGWGPASALLGGLGAGVGLGVIFNFFYGLGFVLTIAVPAFWLGHLSLLARPATAAPALAASEASDPRLDWYPIGRVVLWTASIAALTLILALLMSGNTGEEITGKLRDMASQALNTSQVLNEFKRDLSTEDKERLARFVARAIPLVVVSTTMLMYLLNLWLAARITRTSHRLRRPWPDLHSIELPQTAIIVLAAALLLSFTGGMPALIAQIVVAGLLTAYTLVGFAVLHSITMASANRTWWLMAAYGVLVMFMWLVLFVALIGLLDGALGLRRRFAAPLKPPTLSS